MFYYLWGCSPSMCAHFEFDFDFERNLRPVAVTFFVTFRIQGRTPDAATANGQLLLGS